MITRIDHVAISVADFAAAVRRYASLLGLSACAESLDPGRRAALFALSNARVLLLEAADASAAAGPVSGAISGLGLGAADAASGIAQLQLQGITARALHAHPAALELAALPPAQLWELPLERTRGLPVRIVERPDSSLPAADSFSTAQVEALDHVVVRSAALDQAVSFYGDSLGVRLALDRQLAGTRMLFFRSGGVTLEIIEDGSASAADVFYGLAYRVRDLQAAHLRLTAAGMALTEIRPGRKAGTHVFSTRSSEASVVPTLFIRDPSRDRA